MDNAVNVKGEQTTSCADFSVRAEVQEKPLSPDAPQFGRIDLNAVGPEDDGVVSLRANGRVAANVGECTLDMLESGLSVDAGNQGNIGMRTGSAPAMQMIEMQGNGGSLLIQNGQIPLAPAIEVTMDSIILSVGPNKITIGPTGIEVSGLMVSIEGTTTAEMKALNASVTGSVGVTVKGNATAEISASGITTVKGAMVMIN